MVPSGNNETPGGSASATTRAQITLFSTALLITALDQVVKRVVVNTLQWGSSIDVIGTFVRLTRTSNTGGAFGILRGRGNWFIVVSVAAALTIGVLSRQISRGRRLERFAFSLILGGALGNLVDRLRLGSVVDFVDIGGSAYRFPAFNVADSCITIGVTLLAIGLIFFGGGTNLVRGGAGGPPDSETGESQ
jgi:signal peptidase II